MALQWRRKNKGKWEKRGDALVDVTLVALLVAVVGSARDGASNYWLYAVVTLFALVIPVLMVSNWLRSLDQGAQSESHR